MIYICYLIILLLKQCSYQGVSSMRALKDQGVSSNRTARAFVQSGRKFHNPTYLWWNTFSATRLKGVLSLFIAEWIGARRRRYRLRGAKYEMCVCLVQVSAHHAAIWPGGLPWTGTCIFSIIFNTIYTPCDRLDILLWHIVSCSFRWSIAWYCIWNTRNLQYVLVG